MSNLSVIVLIYPSIWGDDSVTFKHMNLCLILLWYIIFFLPKLKHKCLKKLFIYYLSNNVLKGKTYIKAKFM